MSIGSYLDTQYGVEPLNVIGIQWTIGGDILFYSDDEIPGYSTVLGQPIQANILQLDTLSSGTSLDGSGTATNIAITLSDVDGALKKIYDTIDFHRRPIQIYQYFKGMAFENKLLIFTGEIASPITWNEGARTLSFQAISPLTNVEVGFAPESGQIPNLHEDLIGKAWPLVYGDPYFVPAVPMQIIPSASLVNPFGIADKTIPLEILRLAEQRANALEQAARDLFFAAIAHFNGDEATADALNQESVQLQEMADQIEEQILELSIVSSDQQKWEGKALGNAVIPSYPIPAGGYIVRINETIFVAQIAAFDKANGWQIANFTHISVPGNPTQIIKQGFLFFNSGSQVQILRGLPITYVIGLDCSATAVFAYRSVNGVRKLARVVNAYYETSIGSHFGFISYSTIKFDTSLSAISFFSNERTIALDQYFQQIAEDDGAPRASHIVPSFEWEDQPYCNLHGPSGNPCDIIQDLIAKYSGLASPTDLSTTGPLTVDAASFGTTAGLLTNYPMAFALFDRPNLYQIINSIAYQARCALWIKNRKVYIKYLPLEVPPIKTLTLDDFEANTLQVTTTGTEELITRYYANWKPAGDHPKDNQVIIRHNIAKYGIIDFSYNYFAYNRYDLVEKSATFWTIRKSNTWKLVKGKLLLKHLNLNLYDTVLLDFGDRQSFVSNSPVKAIVQELSYDSVDRSLNVVFWTPIRFGEMEPHPFAWPAELNEGTFFPFFDEITAGNGGAGSFVSGLSGNFQSYNGLITTVKPDSNSPLDLGDKSPSDIGDTPPPATTNWAIVPTPGDIPAFKYEYKNFSIPGVTPTGTSTSSVFPGRIVGKVSGKTYNVKYWDKGFTDDDHDAKFVQAIQIDIDTTETIPTNAPVFVVQNVISNNQKQYTINTPIWLE